MSLLGRPPTGATVLDIGSGQGGLAIHLRETCPDVTVWGVECSAVGVERSRAAAAARGTQVSFTQLDLLQPVALAPGQPPAGYAVCSEVLEHVDDPVRLLCNSKSLLLPGCRMVVTVPGGPRSAFDRHIGHRRHFEPADLRGVLTDAGVCRRTGTSRGLSLLQSLPARGHHAWSASHRRCRAPGQREAVKGRGSCGARLRHGTQACLRRLPAWLADSGSSTPSWAGPHIVITRMVVSRPHGPGKHRRRSRSQRPVTRFEPPDALPQRCDKVRTEGPPPRIGT